jgi:phosphoglycolate phosphatase
MCPMPQKEIELLIFDLDGTLIDSAPDIVATTHALFSERGVPPLAEETVVAAIGEGLKQLVFSLFPETHRDPQLLRQLEDDFYRHYENNLIRRTTIYDGVENFLESNPKKIAIVTNKYARLAERTVTGLGLDRFPWLRVFGADSLANRKPDPLPLIEVMKLAGVSRRQTVMIGDGIPDMVAARRAGVHSIGVTFGYSKPEVLRAQGASLLLDAYHDLPELLRAAADLPPREEMPD